MFWRPLSFRLTAVRADQHCRNHCDDNRQVDFDVTRVYGHNEDLTRGDVVDHLLASFTKK